MSYNRSSTSSGGGAGYGPSGSVRFDADGFLIPDPQPTGRGVPDPRDPQRAPGVPAPGKNFARRDYLLTTAPRGQDAPVLMGPGSAPWRQGSDDVEAKRSYTLRDVNPPRRRRAK